MYLDQGSLRLLRGSLRASLAAVTLVAIAACASTSPPLPAIRTPESLAGLVSVLASTGEQSPHRRCQVPDRPQNRRHQAEGQRCIVLAQGNRAQTGRERPAARHRRSGGPCVRRLSVRLSAPREPLPPGRRSGRSSITSQASTSPTTVYTALSWGSQTLRDPTSNVRPGSRPDPTR